MQDALAIKGLTIRFFTYEGVVEALSEFNLTVQQREVVGLVGESGSGKSVLAHAISGEVSAPGRIVSGEVRYFGEDLLKMPAEAHRRILGKDLCFIVQNARSALNPILTVGQSIVNVIRAHEDLPKKQAKERAIAMLESVGMNDPGRRFDSFPHQMSGGMAQRVVIALALAGYPKVLVADEPTFGLDVTIQAQVLDMFRELLAERGLSALIITRDLGIAAQYCEKVGVLYAGRIVEFGPVLEMFANPRHPYTSALLDTTAARVKAFSSPLLGIKPDLRKLPAGCVFGALCPLGSERCLDTVPTLREVAPNHYVSCHGIPTQQ